MREDTNSVGELDIEQSFTDKDNFDTFWAELQNPVAGDQAEQDNVPQKEHSDFGQLSLRVANGATQHRDAFRELAQCRMRVSNFEHVANNITNRVCFLEAPDGEYTMSKNMEIVPCPEIFNGYSDSSMQGGVWLLHYVFPGTQRGIVTDIQCAMLEKPDAHGPYVLKTPGKLVV